MEKQRQDAVPPSPLVTVTPRSPGGALASMLTVRAIWVAVTEETTEVTPLGLKLTVGGGLTPKFVPVMVSC
jgi:hypothetical protein